MTSPEAIQILNIHTTESEMVQEAFENEVFNLMQGLLKDPVIPKIILSKIEKLKILEEARMCLQKKSDTKKEVEYILINLAEIGEWLQFFNQYEINKAEIRKWFSSNYDANEIGGLLTLLIENEKQYALQLTDILYQLPLEEVKLSEHISLIEVRNELNMHLKQGIIDNSFDSLINIKSNMNIFKLSKELNRLRKLIE